MQKRENNKDGSEIFLIIVLVLLGVIISGAVRKFFPRSKRWTPLVAALGSIFFQRKRRLSNFFAGVALPGLIDYASEFSQPSASSKELGRGRPPYKRPAVYEYRKRIMNVNGKKLRLDFTPWFYPFDINLQSGAVVTTHHLYVEEKRKRGIYFIRDANTEEVVYIGYSNSNVIKACYRHFYDYNDSNRQYRVTYPKVGFQIQFALSNSRELAELEKMFIGDLEPRDNFERYENEEDDLPISDIELNRDEEPPFG